MQEKAAVVEGLSRYCRLPGTRCPGTRWSLLLCVLVLPASGHLSLAAETWNLNNVLVLYSFTDRKVLYAGLILIVLQTLTIIGLLLRRARERKSELRLLESEKRFRLMADTTPALVWMCDAEGEVTYLNERRIHFTGRDPATGLGDVWTAFIHPDDVQSVLESKCIWRSNSGRGFPKNIGFAGGMEFTDGCLISQRRALTAMAHSPGLSARQWTSQTRNSPRKRCRTSVAN